MPFTLPLLTGIAALLAAHAWTAGMLKVVQLLTHSLHMQSNVFHIQQHGVSRRQQLPSMLGQFYLLIFAAVHWGQPLTHEHVASMLATAGHQALLHIFLLLIILQPHLPRVMSEGQGLVLQAGRVLCCDNVLSLPVQGTSLPEQGNLELLQSQHSIKTIEAPCQITCLSNFPLQLYAGLYILGLSRIQYHNHFRAAA